MYKKILPQLKVLHENLEGFVSINSIQNWKDIPFMGTDDIVKINSINIKSGNGYCIYFTSGTVAEPKAIYYNKQDIKNTVNYIEWICGIENIRKGKKVIVLMDQSFFWLAILQCLDMLDMEIALFQ